MAAYLYGSFYHDNEKKEKFFVKIIFQHGWRREGIKLTINIQRSQMKGEEAAHTSTVKWKETEHFPQIAN